MAVLTSDEIREQINAELDAAEAIMNVCKSEKREPTDDEQADWDARMDGESGKVAKLQAQLASREKIEAEQTRLAELRALTNPPKSVAKAALATHQPDQGTTITPVTPHTGHLRAFKGPTAHKDAYDSGMWIRATFLGDDESIQYCRDNFPRADAQTADDSSKGGFLIPTPLSNTIIRIVEDTGVALRLSDVIPMASETLDIGRRSGGLTVYAPAEGTAVTSSEMTWDRVQLNTRDRFTLTRISNKLLRSSITSVADRVAEEIGFAFSKQMDDEWYNGDGTNTYFNELGYKNAAGAAGTKTGTSTTEDTWAELDLANFHETMEILPSKYWTRGVSWVCSSAFYYGTMLRVMSAAGGNTIATIAGPTGNAQFFGYPVFFSDRLPTTSAVSTISVLLGSFRDGCQIGLREGVEISSSEHRYFDSDEVAIRGKISYDINWSDAGDASTAGAVVNFKTGAA